jgi:acyl carrier protein
LAQVWKRVLWLDEDVGVEDTFAELGGHSLLSAQLIIELERELARPLPARALTELGTIAGMARIIEDDTPASLPDGPGAGGDSLPDILRRLRSYTSSWIGARASTESVLVGLNVGGTRTPLFWCLQRYQELTQLARYLGPDQPVYAMRNGHKIMARTDENLALLAAHYADEILAVRPQGPYILGGNCGATRVAFPLALALKARGHEIALLFLHEKFIPRPYAGRVALMFGAQSDRNPYLQYVDPAFGWRKYYSGPISVDIVSGAHAEFFVEPNVQVLTDAIRRRIDELQGIPVQPAAGGPHGTALQRLPDEAYRARFSVRATRRARRGERLRLGVGVRNASSVTWQSADRSGIALVNRWLDRERRPVAWLDGRTPLPADLGPDQTITLELVATAPDAPGEWLLVLDLVDEGVAQFSSMGSDAVALPVVVEDGPAATGQGYNAAISPTAPGR